jgi:hypothetical protein
MKKYLMIIFFLILGLNSFADEIDDLFEQGENIEYQFERFDEANVFRAISHDAGMMCHDGLCTLTSSETRWNNFNINLNGSAGNSLSNNSSFGFGNDNPSITFNNNSQSEDGEILYNTGISMNVNIGNCKRSINVPRAVFYSINRYIYGLMHDDRTTRRTFTPADEAMILFYSTVMKMASGCAGGGGGRH